MSYQIITDSCCDFTKEMYEKLGLAVVPLMVNFRGQTFPDRNDESLKDMYAGLRAGEVATTSAANPGQWQELMEPYLQKGEDLLVLVFSSGLSTTYQSASMAADELRTMCPDRTISVVDSLCASLGEGLLAYYACKKRDEGMPLRELTQWLLDNRLHLCHWFTVDDLMFFKRGGIISAATAVMGTMLKIKPVLHVDDLGHLVNVSKARGRRASIDAMAAKVGQTGIDPGNQVFFISHGDCLEDAKYLADSLRRTYHPKDVVIGYVGPVIGSHSSPGTLALFFLGSQR